MFSIILISFAIICASPAHIGAGYTTNERVMNSWDADEWRFSHVVAIINRYGPEDRVQCGGSLLTTSIVLTACHCVVMTDTNEFFETYHLYAMAGVKDFLDEQGKQVRDFREENGFAVHRECNLTRPVGHDVGLGFLVKPFELTKTVRLVKFISTDDQTLWYWLNHFRETRKTCHIMGWGLTNYTLKQQPTRLQDGRVTLINEKECEENACTYFDYCDKIIAAKKKICTIPYERSMTCKGDSGGPLMCNEYIFGIVSGGSTKCKVSSLVPTFYCNPLTILEFIRYYVPDYKTTPFPLRQDPPSVVAPFKYPFVVSIANVSNKYIPQSICAGSILTKSAVITTCQCVLKLEDFFANAILTYKEVVVISGITNIFEDSLYKQQLNIARIEEVCKSRNDVGIGIVFVQGEFPFGTRLVQPLKMLSDDAVTVRKLIKTLRRSGKKCFMATWGYVIEKPTLIRYNVFAEWEVRLRRPRDCTTGPFCVTHRTLCTAIEYNYETLCGEAYKIGTFCFGDSGGPLICEGYFMGVVLYNGELCYRNNNVLITSLIGILDFVKEVIPDYSVRNIISKSRGSGINSPFIQLWYIVLLLIPFV